MFGKETLASRLISNGRYFRFDWRKLEIIRKCELCINIPENEISQIVFNQVSSTCVPYVIPHKNKLALVKRKSLFDVVGFEICKYI